MYNTSYHSEAYLIQKKIQGKGNAQRSGQLTRYLLLISLKFKGKNRSTQYDVVSRMMESSCVPL